MTNTDFYQSFGKPFFEKKSAESRRLHELFMTKYYLPECGHLEVRNTSYQEVNMVLAEMKRRKLAPGTIKSARSTFSQYFCLAMEMGEAEANPVKDTRCMTASDYFSESFDNVVADMDPGSNYAVLSIGTLQEVFHRWAEVNPCHFQKSLLLHLSSVLRMFRKLNGQTYMLITDETIDLMIHNTKSIRSQQEMRFLIQMLDRYMADQLGESFSRVHHQESFCGED